MVHTRRRLDELYQAILDKKHRRGKYRQLFDEFTPAEIRAMEQFVWGTWKLCRWRLYSTTGHSLAQPAVSRCSTPLDERGPWNELAFRRFEEGRDV